MVSKQKIISGKAQSKPATGKPKHENVLASVFNKLWEKSV
jgi:hypothetical protein